MKIAFSNDHAATAMRAPLLEHLKKGGHEVLDFGTSTADSVDYPQKASEAVRAVQRQEADAAVLMCGTGIGMCIAANKFRGIRCAVCTDEYAARMAREHNNANVLALRGRRMDPDQNIAILDAFINTAFAGGRHQRRLDQIAALEQESEDAGS